MLCGESQGGVMASLLAAEHLRRGRDKRLLGVFLLRSAPDPLTWGAWPSSPPDSKPPDVAGITWGAFVGESDEIFPEAFVRYALSPVRGAHFSVAKGVTHYDAERSVYEAAMASFARWARQRL
jgi:pimeloyl-ACP methyl ester carboxylesterase